MLKITKPATITLTFLTLAGLLMHDMHIDRATTVAITLPTMVATTAGAYEKVISSNYHTHVERASLPRFATQFRSNLPNMHPPRDDDRRYVQNKKLLYMGGGDAVSLWPSV